MGRGYDFVKRKALEQAKQQLQKLVSNNLVDKNPFQIAKINNAQNEATLPTGETVEVEATGLPGPYGTIANGLIIAPEPYQIQYDSAPVAAYVAGWDGTNHYIRPVGSDQKWILPETGFDSRIDRSSIQIRTAADGKAVLIGGFYQDYPPLSAYSYQISTGTGGCQGNCVSIPGYTYQTFAQFNVFVDFKLLTNPDGSPNFTYAYMASENKNLSEDVVGYIPAPTQGGYSSSSIFRLFPTNSDIYYGSGPRLPGDGPAVDLEGHPVDARFFPEVYNEFVWSQEPLYQYDAYVGSSPFLFNRQWYGVGGNGNMTTSWSNLGNPTLPLLLNDGMVPLAIDDSFLSFVFAPNSDGSKYYVDVVGDISFTTVYKIDYIRYETNSTFNNVNVEVNTGCPYTKEYGSQTENFYQTFTYDFADIISGVDPTWSIHYPYLGQWYQSFSDQYVLGISRTTGGIDPHSPDAYHNYNNSGTGISTGAQDSCASIIVNDVNVTIQRYVCAGAEVTGGLWCSYWNLTPGVQEGAGFNGGLISGAVFFGNIYCYAPQDSLTVRTFDGASVTITGPPLGFPSVGLSGFIPYFSASSCGSCANIPTYGSHPECDCFIFVSLVIDGSYTGGGSCGGGWGFIGTGATDVYRFGRGNAAYEKIMTIQRTEGGGVTSSSADYLGAPSIAFFRLASHSNQNRLFYGFRGTSGGTALVYANYDPFIPPTTAYGAQISYTQFIDALNGDDIYSGRNVFYQGPDDTFQSFDAYLSYFYCSPYVPLSSVLYVDENNQTEPPDVFTDRVLAGPGQWPFTNNRYLNPIDSFVIDGYLIETGEDGRQREIIHEYTVQETGLTTQTRQAAGAYRVTGETIKDFILSLKLT